jgi:hypothetical protein
VRRVPCRARGWRAPRCLRLERLSRVQRWLPQAALPWVLPLRAMIWRTMEGPPSRSMELPLFQLLAVVELEVRTVAIQG